MNRFRNNPRYSRTSFLNYRQTEPEDLYSVLKREISDNVENLKQSFESTAQSLLENFKHTQQTSTELLKERIPQSEDYTCLFTDLEEINCILQEQNKCLDHLSQLKKKTK